MPLPKYFKIFTIFRKKKKRSSSSSVNQPLGSYLHKLCLRFSLSDVCVLQCRPSPSASPSFFTTSSHLKRGLPSGLFPVGTFSTMRLSVFSLRLVFLYIVLFVSLYFVPLYFYSLLFSLYSFFGRVFLILHFFVFSTPHLTCRL